MKVNTKTRKQVVKDWVAALRSGKYKQTQDQLRDDEGFCCLGVLCDLSRKDGGSKWEKNSEGNFAFKGRNSYLPDEIEDFIFNGFRNKLTTSTLMNMNDTGKSFKKIADVIERKLL